MGMALGVGKVRKIRVAALARWKVDRRKGLSYFGYQARTLTGMPLPAIALTKAWAFSSLL
jgi:hypothetical protein